MRGWVFRVENERSLDQRDGQVRPPGLLGENAEMMEGLGVIRLLGEDLAIKRLGLLETPGLMMLESQRESLVRGHGDGEGFSAHQCFHMVR